MSAVGDDLVDYVVKPNFRALGKRFGKGPRRWPGPSWRWTRLAAARAAVGRKGALKVDGTQVPLSADDLIVTQTPRSGWAVASDGGETIGLEPDHP